MRKTLFTLTLIAMLAPFAAAQNNRIAPAITVRGSAQALSSKPATERLATSNSYYWPFCRRKVCLYYAGDYDSNWIDGSGLFNANDTGDGLDGQVWVGVKPNHDATVTGATFVEFVTAGYTGTNPIPFAVQVGIKPGQAGKTVCSSNASATYKVYGYFGEAPAYRVTIKSLPKSCKLKKNQLYYVNLLPTSSNGYGYLLNLPPDPLNHHGWKNDPDHCYFNSASFGIDYQTCNSQGHFSELQIALTGKQTK
jgi:hypothetical protein